MKIKSNLKECFNFLENSDKIKKNHFEKLLRKLNKPLFTMEEIEEGLE